ncbi:uncharacterized protein [Amphiura filiformis]|uniref:uncharacterized protein n=1 Tax=Amphiura filiformis TaxID=82378 RepID=UPI003B20B92D
MTSCISSGFDLADVSIPEFPAGQHPVFMEIGYETDTGPIGLKPFWMDFEEFKYDIPYVKALGANPEADVFPLNFKSVLYLPTFLLAESSRLSYNLNASEADIIAMTDVSYNIQKEGSKFKADFKPDGDWEAYGPRFGIIEKVVSQRWFGRWDSNSRSCADHHYDFNTIKFRSATGNIQADKEIVSPFFPSDIIKVPSLNQIPYGTVEVFANFTITSAFDCLP